MNFLKRVFIVLSSAIIILANPLLTFLAITTVQAAEGDILVSDNFSDGNLDGWTIQYGNWYINPQGNLAGSNSGKMLGGRINTGSSEWDNYRIELDMNGFQGIDGGVGFRYTPNGNSYELNLRFGTGAYNTPEAILKRTQDGLTTIIGDTHSLSLIDQKWHHLKIELSNENMKIWLNNSLIFDISDTGTKVKKGTLMLSYWTGDIGVAYMKFDNIVVSALAPPPPPRLPVIFIPGIGGSELKANQDIVWSAQNGHGGIYSHGYPAGEKIWVNQNEAAKLGDDDYFDVLRLKSDGQTSQADLNLTDNLSPFGYLDIDSFFTGLGYEKNTNFFVFPYDWRKDIRSTKDDLDALIELAKQKSGQSKVNLVVHSMGGLVARYYISDSQKAAKVNKLVELGVPHLGAVDTIKSLIYGTAIKSKVFGILPLGIPNSEVRDTSQNMTSVFQLLPSNQYFSFYSNADKNYPYPFQDDRDIDNNNETGTLNFNQTKTLLSNLGHNMTAFNLAEQFHSAIDPLFNQTNGVKIYEIAGTAQPTLGQLHETWWVTWPFNLIPKTDEIFINGDDTVPLYSASLKNDSQDLSGASKIYYVEQKHSDLVSGNGAAMQTVKSILNDDNSLPVEVRDQKIALEGQDISIDNATLDIYDESGNHTGLDANGELENNISNTFYDSIGNSKHIFVKKSSKKVTAKVTSATTTKTKIKIRDYSQDSINKTILYNDVPITTTAPVQFTIDPEVTNAPTLTAGAQTILATAEATGSAALDQTAPKTTFQISGTKDPAQIYSGPVTMTLTGKDIGSGILKTEYSLDNGQTVQIYTAPFTISAPGKTIIQFRSIDNLGNEEIPQSITIEIALPPTPTPSPTFIPVLISTTNDSSNNSSSTNSVNNSSVTNPADNTVAIARVAKSKIPERGQSTNSITSITQVLGVSFKNPSQIAQDLAKAVISDQGEIIQPVDNLEHKTETTSSKFNQILSGLLTVTTILASGGLLLLTSTFIKPFPDKM